MFGIALFFPALVGFFVSLFGAIRYPSPRRWAVVCVTAASAAVVLWLGISAVHRDTTMVIRSSPAGNVDSVLFMPGGPSGARMQINTDKSAYLVDGAVAVVRGIPLTVQLRANGDNYLCSQEDSGDFCLPLVNTRK